MLDQVEGEQHCFMSLAFAPQRTEVRRPVVASDHELAIKRRCLEAVRGINDSREAIGPVMAAAREAGPVVRPGAPSTDIRRA